MDTVAEPLLKPKSPPLSDARKLDRVLWLDALRGIAALAVTIYHARAILWIGVANVWREHGIHPDFNAALGYLTTPFSLGYLGVTLFFVISGFSIHLRSARNLVTDSLNATLPLKPFFLRRFLRLYPTYFVTLFVAACGDFYLAQHSVASLGDHQPSTFLAALFMLQGILTPPFGSTSVFWTLVIELHLYLAYPFLFHLSRKRGPGCVLLMTFLISIGANFLFRNGHSEVEGPPIFLKHWFAWTMGFYIAELTAGRVLPHKWFTSPLLPSGCFLLGAAITALKSVDFAEMPFAVCFAWLLVLCHTRPRLNANFFIRIIAPIGIMSYSLYCIHVPMLTLVRFFINAGEPSTSILPLVAGTFFSLCAAAILYWVIEHWSISWSRKLRMKPTTT